IPRKPSRAPIVCEYFTWRLLQRDGVFYADGRTGKFNLGKHSLATRDYQEALSSLRRLDRHMAIQRGLASAAVQSPDPGLPVGDGWERFLKHCQRPAVLGGVSAGTLKRYRAVRDKHVAFCARQGIQLWSDVNKHSVEEYSCWLQKRDYAYRSLYLEL